MKKRKVSFVILLLLGLALKGVNAQEALPASGGDATGNSGSVSYSIGQVFYTSHNGSDGSVAQGVQQIYIISDETGIDDIPGINLSVSAYPNPVTDYLTLCLDETVMTRHDLSQLSYRLYSMNGKLLQIGKITGSQTRIAMNKLVPATYFVKVLDGKGELKMFKIIKTQ